MTGRADKAWETLRDAAARVLGTPAEPPPPAALRRLGEAPRTFVLHGAGPWWVGRGPRAQVRLDDDPYVSRRHLRVRRHGGAFTVEAAPGAVNAASLGTSPLPPGVPVLLPPGAVLVAGRSRLVLQPPEGEPPMAGLP